MNQEARGKPNKKHDWPSKFALKPFTGRGITLYSTAAYFVFSLLLTLSTSAIAAEPLLIYSISRDSMY